MDLNEIMIDLRKCNKWYQDRFPNKDVITIDNLLSDYEDMIDEIKYLEDRISDLEIDIATNYRRIDPYEDDRYL